MPFQIRALEAEAFSKFFAMDDAELAQHNICKMTVTSHPGTPCRVSLADAEIGETVLLLNYEHQPAKTPYKSCHAIFVRQGAQQARPLVGEVPKVLLSRLISVRHFDHDDMMINADVMPGNLLAEGIEQAFSDPRVSYLHLHYAKPGCFAASVVRA
ncbi:MAG: DUF1203 domain-containing protein [Pseudorhodobacter sp.]|nr:DUF1203 domain-containing protein [Pseudorhodobacter sp.]